MFTDGFIKVADVIRHTLSCNCLSCLFHNYHLSNPMQPPHFVDESLHDNDGDDREQDFMILQLVDFKYHKTLVQQVELLIRVQQVIVLPAKIVGSQYVKKIGEVEILLPVVFLFQYLSEFPLHELIKSIERRNQLLVFFYPFDEQVDRHRKGYFLGTANGIRIPFSKGHNQRFNGLFLLQVKDLV